MSKVVLKAEMQIADAKILVSLLRMAAWREFWKVDTQVKQDCLRNERLLKDLAFDLQQAITKQMRTSKEVTK